MEKEQTNVLHIIDALEAGGAERVAVNLVNLLPRDRYRAYLCTTRKEGSLSTLVAEDVHWLKLHRKRHADLKALACLVRFIQKNKIRIIHAHSNSLFIAAEVKLLLPGLRILWHVHTGALASGLPFPHKVAVHMIDGVITVNEPLALRIKYDLILPDDRVWYLRNFSVQENGKGIKSLQVEFPGKAGKKIVCVSNFRAEKDHDTLVKAFLEVVRKDPEARLFLIGMKVDEGYYSTLLDLISELSLTQQVILLGQRDDVQQILSNFDVGVLSSRSEGLPLALLEYGQAKLAVVVTDVGQCREVVDDGWAGLVVPPGDINGLATAMNQLLEDHSLRQRLGETFYQHIKTHYSAQTAIEEIDNIYLKLLNL